MARRYSNFINGVFAPSTGCPMIPVVNPATEEVVSEVPDSSVAEANAAVEAAYAARKEWARTPSIERAEYIRRLCREIRDNKEMLARVITEENGKPLSAALGEVDFCLSLMEYAAEWARRLEGDVIPSDFRGQNIFLYRQPYGVASCIIPWNFPLAIIGRKVGPALIAGNCVVVKPSSETPNQAFEFAELVQKAGLPKGVVNVISGRGATVGKTLVTNPKVGIVSHTGSVEAGQQVMRDAAANLTKVSLELGGKAPSIVMDDADLNLACSCCYQHRFFDVAGQACVAAERIYVQEGIARKFVESLVATVKGLKLGDPTDAATTMGPLVSKNALEKVQGMVDRAVKGGATVQCGGKRPGNLAKGYYYEGTVLTNVRQDMEIMQKEIFGPVIPVMTFKTLDEAIALANDCEYGLASAIYTRDLRAAMRAANELEFGETYVNRPPFDQIQGFHAGWKKSGLGGDDGKHGVYEFLQTHLVTINYA
jgi:lactaldehyde dehydrogenase/glycolaldehyde dehydrogenase